MLFELFCVDSMDDIHVINVMYIFLIECHTIWILKHVFFAETFQTMNAVLTFQIR